MKYAFILNGISQAALWPSIMTILARNLDEKNLKRSAFALSTPVSLGTLSIYGIARSARCPAATKRRSLSPEALSRSARSSGFCRTANSPTTRTINPIPRPRKRKTAVNPQAR
ncbi:MAG: hypothetical protein ACLUSP_09335 [Christensenellales bacterium]